MLLDGAFSLARSKSLHFRVEAALVTCCFVLFDDAFVRHTINDWNGRIVCFLRRPVLACVDRCEYLLHLSANE